MKDRESITIDNEVNEQVKTQADKEGRSYSNMLEWMAKKYLESKKQQEYEELNNKRKYKKPCNSETI